MQTERCMKRQIRAQFWNLEVYEEKNDLQGIEFLQWEWECEEKHGQGVHKNVMGTEDDFQ